jgi:hypothetical protein
VKGGIHGKQFFDLAIARQPDAKGVYFGLLEELIDRRGAFDGTRVGVFCPLEFLVDVVWELKRPSGRGLPVQFDQLATRDVPKPAAHHLFGNFNLHGKPKLD